MSDIKQTGKIMFRKLWSNINKDNKHLTTEMIEDLIDQILDLAIAERDREWVEQLDNIVINHVGKTPEEAIQTIINLFNSKK